MNIYEFQSNGEKEWICADTLIEAFQFYNSLNDLEINDFDKTDDVVLIPESEWNEYKIVDTEHNSEHPDHCPDKTFAEYMINQTEVEIIATTCY